ncbi:MAG TPA: nucleotide disphospho-sugar-binding domain-containing protein [Chitinophagaceae bacterium]
MKAPHNTLSYTELIANTHLQPGTKILFAHFPGDGHFNPLTGLAVHLKALGCDVRWYTSPHYAGKIKKMDMPYYLFDKAVDVHASNIEQVFPERAKCKSQVSKLKFDMIHAFVLRSPEYYEDLRELKRTFNFGIMICDNTFGAIPFVREKLHVPVIAISIVPLVETSRDLPPAGLGLTPSGSYLGRRRQDLLRYLADKFLFARPVKVMQAILRSYGIDPGKWNIFDILLKKADLVLQSGVPGFEYRRSDMGANIHFIGPLLPYAPKQKGPRWYDKRLTRYKKVVLVTQGTVEKDPSKLLEPTLEAFKNTDTLVIATTGGSGTTKLRELYPWDNILIEDFIPFDDVMPYADVYVTNGGYGGVLLGIQNSLPLVVAGVHEGKNEICARVDYFRLGINLETETPSPQKLKAAVENVMADQQYKINVALLKEEFTHYHPDELCAYYVSELLREKTKKALLRAKLLQEV